jgi:hypothetical protein
MEELHNEESVEPTEEELAPKTPLSDKVKAYFFPKDIQLDMLRYRPNKLAYMLGLGAALLLAAGFCCFYSGTELDKIDNFNLLGITAPGPILGVDIVINILMMLFMLFSAMEMKNYSLKLGYVSMGIGAFQIIRIFLLPLALTRIGCMNGVIFALITVFYAISGAFSIIAGFLSVYRGTALRNYLKTVDPIENEKVGK